MHPVALAIAVILLAFFTGSDSLYYLAYALAAIALLSRWWTRRAVQGIRIERQFTPRAFYGERIMVKVSITNRSRLPVPWLHLHESLPIALHAPNFERRVVSLGPGERATFTYTLNGSHRGYYALGPLITRMGDLLGVAPELESQAAPAPLIIYPRIVPLRELGIPSQLPFGTIASQQRIFQDPSRFLGVRQYVPTDSLRSIHWKSSARLDTLQTKRFQPAIALNTQIILDLNRDDYDIDSQTTAQEMGIVIAASIAAHLSEQRQPVGLAVLGSDTVSGNVGMQNIPPAHGREHLIRLLEALARAEMGATAFFADQLPATTTHLGWGSTVIVIVPGEQAGLITALLQVRRQGLNVVVIATDPMNPFGHLHGLLDQAAIPGYLVTQDNEMERWR